MGDGMFRHTRNGRNVKKLHGFCSRLPVSGGWLRGAAVFTVLYVALNRASLASGSVERMSRGRALGIGVVVLVLVTGWFLRARNPKPAQPALGAGASAPARSSTSAGPPIELAVHSDTDQPGILRLEGQVIDDAERPVARAQVRIDATPPRIAITDVGGSFVFDRLAGRTYVVLAHASGRVAGPVRVHLTSATQPITLRLH